jgi:osmotically-inducible protein OsmY
LKEIPRRVLTAPRDPTDALARIVDPTPLMRTTMLMAVCAAVLVSSPARADNPADANPTGDKPGLSENASGAEASLVVTVQRQLAADPELAREPIQVEGNERRMITLRGNVRSPRLRDRAEDVAQHVANVQHVENRLVVRGDGVDERGDGPDAMTNQGRPADRDVTPDFPPR